LVNNVGPWNINDTYWKKGNRPQAETGVAKFNRKTNRAGIDLSNELFRQLGLKDNDYVEWRFINTPNGEKVE